MHDACDAGLCLPDSLRELSVGLARIASVSGDATSTGRTVGVTNRPTVLLVVRTRTCMATEDFATDTANCSVAASVYGISPSASNNSSVGNDLKRTSTRAMVTSCGTSTGA